MKWAEDALHPEDVDSALEHVSWLKIAAGCNKFKELEVVHSRLVEMDEDDKALDFTGAGASLWKFSRSKTRYRVVLRFECDPHVIQVE